MPSSTSSSESRRWLDGGDWAKTLALALALAALVLVPWELYWRGRGARPSISDLVASWSVAVDRVAADAIVLAGTSKMQSAIDPTLLGELLGVPSASQLAVIDRSPLPVLELLAADETFGGLVIVDVAAGIFFDATGARERAMLDLLRAYRRYRTSPGDRLDARLVLATEDRLVTRLPNLSLRRLLARYQTGVRLRVPFARVRPDRFRELDLDGVNIAGRQLNQALVVQTRGRAATPDEVRHLGERVRAATERIRLRGGEVVLTLLPVSGRVLEVETERFPRGAYWDVLATAAETPAVHFADDRRLAGFTCRDGNHLELDDALQFTRAFAEVLRETVPTRF